MYPELFRIGPVVVYSYGFALAAAFLAAFFLARAEARRKGMETEVVYDLVLAAAVGGILGSRLIYVLANWPEFALNPLHALAIWEGGLVFYGGLVGGALTCWLVILRKKLSFFKVADMVAPSLAMGAAVGRVGCFLNGCCYGVITNLPWAVYLNGEPRHPTQLYDMAYNLVIFGVLWNLRKRIAQEGLLFWLFLMMYSIGRFGVEFLRVNPRILAGLSGSQLTSFVLFVVSAGIVIVKYKPWLRKKGS